MKEFFKKALIATGIASGGVISQESQAQQKDTFVDHNIETKMSNPAPVAEGYNIGDKFINKDNVETIASNKDNSSYEEMVIINETPEAITTAKGNVITRSQWQKSKENGIVFSSLREYAQWIDGWAKPWNFAPGKIYSLSKSETSGMKSITTDDLVYVKSQYPKLRNPFPMSNSMNSQEQFSSEESDIIRQILLKRDIDKQLDSKDTKNSNDGESLIAKNK
ncbi:hypothetical protein K8Q96_02115 [Candidatus Nomurabacteria bacterium]|nr:hypothetical protein [Candidatus Nomurabacteria bacterium]